MSSGTQSQRLSITEKVGYSLGDAAANFVFMTMILFQANFYTDVMGIAAGTAGIDHPAASRAVGRVFRSADGRRWPTARERAGAGSARGFLFTALPWGIVMFLAYRRRPAGASTAIVAYALRHEHPADDALFGQQHAVRGAGRRDDGRLVRADEPELRTASWR